MRFVGLMVVFLGTWGFFRPISILKGIYKNFYKKEFPAANKRGKAVVQVLSLLWVVMGLIIFLKG